MSNYEYMVDSVFSTGPLLEAVLNTHGSDRWELVLAMEIPGGYRYVFKRPVAAKVES